MVSAITKWGNSLAIRIPQHLARAIDLAEGVEVSLAIVEGNLVLKPQRQQRYSLDELVAQITPENCHAEIETGESVGSEAW